MTGIDDYFLCFARTLAQSLGRSARGVTDEFARLVGTRPAEAVLAGFLTPARRSSGSVHGAEEEAEEMPGDRPEELSNIGLEWLLRSVVADFELEVEFQAHVYVRRIPPPEVALRHAAYRHLDQTSSLVQIWTREVLGPIRVSIPWREIRDAGRKRIELDGEIARSAAGIPRDSLYTAREAIRATEQQIAAGEYVGPAGRQPARLDWSATLDVRVLPSPEPGAVRVLLRVVNTGEQSKRGSDDFFDPNLYAATLAVSFPRSAHSPMRFEALPNSYRYDLTLPALGLNCQAEEVGSAASVMSLRTETIPQKEVPRLEARDLGPAQPRFRELSEDPIPILQAIAREMRAYRDGTWANKVRNLQGLAREEAADDLKRFARDEIERFERGIELLGDERFAEVRDAFQLMNLSMIAVGQKTKRKYEAWRLFQIVFIVAQLPELAARRVPNPYGTAADDIVDILWFAAGGGKTEAFLGLLLWQAFYDRLTGKRFGVTALLRFPLRLLAFQQLQRLADALAEADRVREQRGLRGQRFSLGYFVGDSVLAPNEINEDLHRQFSAGTEDTPPRIKACPYCGSEVRVAYDAPQKWLHHRCTSSKCEFYAQPLPISHTDGDCYRWTPTVVVSTVDKLAIFGQNVRFGNLLGRIDAYCHKHGATFRNSNQRCPAAQLLAKGEAPDGCDGAEFELGPFAGLGPALLIQDELHLLTEELGIFDAHYETAVMSAMSRMGQRPWKTIAATATISTFEDHAHHLYLRRARQFPAPGPEAFESFYYKVVEGSVGRIFLGVLGVGRAHTPTVSKLMALIYNELDSARTLASADLDAVNSKYGTVGATQQQVEEIVFYYEVLLTYVLTKKGSDQVAEAVESRVQMDVDSPLRIETFNSGIDMAAMTAAIKEIEESTIAMPLADRVRGVIATNIISHGVDIERFNVMVFAGFTRLIAEYIQASARVGRRRPGIVFLAVTPQSERDRSVYQQFAKFHEYVDRLVDPSALNRWPGPAMQRTCPGLVAGYLMSVASAAAKQRLDTVEAVQKAFASAASDTLLERELLAYMDEALAVQRSPSASYAGEVRRRAANLYSTVINAAPLFATGRPRTLGMFLASMRSLRDVDDPAYITVESPAARAVMRALGGDVE